MKWVAVFALALMAPGFVTAQETRKEIPSPPNVVDSRPNSAEVPEVYATSGQFERVLVIRLKYKTDLLAGLEKAVVENQIRSGVILAGTGSVTSYHYHAISNTSFPTRNIFVRNQASPADLVGMNGYVVNGRVHAHATFTNTRKAFGGHLESGTTVFTFAIITVGVFPDSVDLGRIDDKNYR